MWQRVKAQLVRFSTKKWEFSYDSLMDIHKSIKEHIMFAETNQDRLIEDFRLLCESLVWAEKNDSRLIEYFLRERMLIYFTLALCKQFDTLTLSYQVLQAANIIFENIKSTRLINGLLCDQDVNFLIFAYSKCENEEMTAMFITFLKTLSFRIDVSNLDYFFDQHGVTFPLLNSALLYYDHQESMVNSSVKTIFTNVLKLYNIERFSTYFNNNIFTPLVGTVLFNISKALERAVTIYKDINGYDASLTASKHSQLLRDLGNVLEDVEDHFLFLFEIANTLDDSSRLYIWDKFLEKIVVRFTHEYIIEDSEHCNYIHLVITSIFIHFMGNEKLRGSLVRYLLSTSFHPENFKYDEYWDFSISPSCTDRIRAQMALWTTGIQECYLRVSVGRLRVQYFTYETCYRMKVILANLTSEDTLRLVDYRPTDRQNASFTLTNKFLMKCSQLAELNEINLCEERNQCLRLMLWNIVLTAFCHSLSEEPLENKLEVIANVADICFMLLDRIIERCSETSLVMSLYNVYMIQRCFQLYESLSRSEEVKFVKMKLKFYCYRIHSQIKDLTNSGTVFAEAFIESFRHFDNGQDFKIMQILKPINQFIEIFKTYKYYERDKERENNMKDRNIRVTYKKIFTLARLSFHIESLYNKICSIGRNSSDLMRILTRPDSLPKVEDTFDMRSEEITFVEIELNNEVYNWFLVIKDEYILFCSPERNEMGFGTVKYLLHSSELTCNFDNTKEDSMSVVLKDRKQRKLCTLKFKDYIRCLLTKQKLSRSMAEYKGLIASNLTEYYNSDSKYDVFFKDLDQELIRRSSLLSDSSRLSSLYDISHSTET